MDEYSDRSLKSQSSHGSLEDEYIKALYGLDMVMCIDREEAVHPLTPSPEAQLMINVESEMFSEPPEPYFTVSCDSFETGGVTKSAEVESLRIEVSNVS